MTVPFPLSRQEWYDSRDDRTRRVSGSIGFENYRVRVSIADSVRTDYSVQVLSLLTLNILARWCRCVTLDVPDDSISRLPGTLGKGLGEVLVNTMQRVDPYGTFRLGTGSTEESEPLLTLGPTSDRTNPSAIGVDGFGWVGGVWRGGGSGLSTEVHRDTNPIGPALASCLGVAELFRDAIGVPAELGKPQWYSLYDLRGGENPVGLDNPSFPADAAIGNIQQVGCGAVGSSLDFLFSFTHWSGRVDLIDEDVVDPTNCNRSLAFEANDCTPEKSKVEVCSRVLGRGAMQPIPHRQKYAAFVDGGSYLRPPPDMILCLANEDNVWSTIQSNFPPLTLHATTTTSWGVNLGRHFPKRDWCLLCTFGEELDHNFVPPCGEGPVGIIPETGQTVEGVLPFLSPLSSVILLSEIAKLQSLGRSRSENFVDFSVKRRRGEFLAVHRGPKPGCVCGDQPLDLYPAQIKSSKYWSD